MGNVGHKIFHRNKKFKEIGDRENKKNPNSFLRSSILPISNNTIINSSKSSPEEEYTKIKFLGEGSFASVFAVQNKISGIKCAMKVIKKTETCSKDDEQEIINEIFILKKMDHPNILKIFEFYSNKDEYSIVTELCEGGELFQEIIDKGPFTEKYSAYVMYQILSAVNYCHNMRIIHRDLKPENILIIDKNEIGLPTIKICDFGTSKIVEKGAVQRRLVGSSYYIAPEVIKKNYNEKCDLWSCGVILYILLSGRPPFAGEDDKEIMKSVSEGRYNIFCKPFDKVSKNVIDLIQKLLLKDPNKRINAEQALNHPWFKEFKSKELYNQITDENIVKKMLNNIEKYKRDSVIQETALAYIVHNFSQMPDVVNACKLFNQIDVNGDGKITKDEFFKGLEKKINSKNLKNEVDKIFNNLDMDKSGFIEYEEFVRAAVNKEFLMNEEILRFAFRYFDKDNSGEITFDEIEEVFKDSVTKKSKVKNYLSSIIKQVDSNGDGKISFDEFSAIMMQMFANSK